MAKIHCVNSLLQKRQWNNQHGFTTRQQHHKAKTDKQSKSKQGIGVADTISHNTDTCPCKQYVQQKAFKNKALQSITTALVTLGNSGHQKEEPMTDMFLYCTRKKSSTIFIQVVNTIFNNILNIGVLISISLYIKNIKPQTISILLQQGIHYICIKVKSALFV